MVNYDPKETVEEGTGALMGGEALETAEAEETGADLSEGEGAEYLQKNNLLCDNRRLFKHSFFKLKQYKKQKYENSTQRIEAPKFQRH